MIAPDTVAAVLLPLAERAVDIATLVAAIADPRERDDSNVVKAVLSLAEDAAVARAAQLGEQVEHAVLQAEADQHAVVDFVERPELIAGRVVNGADPVHLGQKEDLAAELGLEPGEVVIDFPAKPAMFQLDLLVERRDGEIQRLDLAGVEGILVLPTASQELYTTARVLRVFTFERRELSAEQVLERITRPVGST